MSWARFTRSGTAYIPSRRQSLTLDATGGAAAADYQVVIPPDWSEFWDNIDSSGFEIYLADADGITGLSWKWTGFSKSNRTGTIQIDNYTTPAAAMAQIFLYWGDMSGAVDGGASFTASSPRTGYLDLGAPQEPTVSALPERSGDAKPRAQASKASSEEIWVWFDLAPVLQNRLEQSDSRLQYEEIDTVSYDVQASGSSVGAMVTSTSARIVEGRYAKVLVKAGDSGTDYVVILTTRTTTPTQAAARILERRALVRVRNVSE